jgi:hypothetical protein
MTYDHILCAISEEDSVYAIRVLNWLAVTTRPLCLEEVAEIVAIDIDREPAFEPDEVLEDPSDVLSICSSLISITMQESQPFQQVVVLAHYSVKEYLVSTQCRQGPAARYGMQEVALSIYFDGNPLIRALKNASGYQSWHGSRPSSGSVMQGWQEGKRIH